MRLNGPGGKHLTFWASRPGPAHCAGRLKNRPFRQKQVQNASGAGGVAPHRTGGARRAYCCEEFVRTHATVCAAYTPDPGPPDAVSRRAGQGARPKSAVSDGRAIFATFAALGGGGQSQCVSHLVRWRDLAELISTDIKFFTWRSRGTEWRPREAAVTLYADHGFPTHLAKGPSCLSWYLELTKLRLWEIFGDRVRSFLLSNSRRGCILCAMEIPILPGITLNRSDGATQCPAAH